MNWIAQEEIELRARYYTQKGFIYMGVGSYKVPVNSYESG